MLSSSSHPHTWLFLHCELSSLSYTHPGPWNFASSLPDLQGWVLLEQNLLTGPLGLQGMALYAPAWICGDLSRTHPLRWTHTPQVHGATEFQLNRKLKRIKLTLKHSKLSEKNEFAWVWHGLTGITIKLAFKIEKKE